MKGEILLHVISYHATHDQAFMYYICSGGIYIHLGSIKTQILEFSENAPKVLIQLSGVGTNIVYFQQTPKSH